MAGSPAAREPLQVLTRTGRQDRGGGGVCAADSREANARAAEAAKRAAEALAMAEELAAAIVSCSVEMRE